MPWDAGTFRARHWQHATAWEARRAAEIANAVLEDGADEGTAIAKAIKQARREARDRKGDGK